MRDALDIQVLNRNLVAKATEVKNKTTTTEDRCKNGWIWVVSDDRKTSIQINPKNLQKKIDLGFRVLNVNNINNNKL
jgi:hypothetical protein